ncbi:hypothetical protein [Roseibium aggregatum]|uniref:hypothetical protein n=1 Tax=Roseibium aggregatum TaxID=187304 RepID=UPI0025ACA339|nr:hypothetical protein [Roseibium aggregatum]WJS05204.1 hypothetical protein QUB73_13245 [Roseibium aggregatum]
MSVFICACGRYVDTDLKAFGAVDGGMACLSCVEVYGCHNEEGNDMPNPIMKYFEFAHLPDHLQKVSRPFGELASQLNEDLPDGPEKSTGLRKLLEAKDCMVRAALG